MILTPHASTLTELSHALVTTVTPVTVLFAPTSMNVPKTQITAAEMVSAATPMVPSSALATQVTLVTVSTAVTLMSASTTPTIVTFMRLAPTKTEVSAVHATVATEVME